MLPYDLDKEKAVGTYFKMDTAMKNVTIKHASLMDAIVKKVGLNSSVMLIMTFTALRIMLTVNATKDVTALHVDGMGWIVSTMQKERILLIRLFQEAFT